MRRSGRGMLNGSDRCIQGGFECLAGRQVGHVMMKKGVGDSAAGCRVIRKSCF